MHREAVIAPGSSSWWLLTLSPIIYLDRIRVSAQDLYEVRQQEDMSIYHASVASVLTALEAHADEELLIEDTELPGTGDAPAITQKARRLADTLVDHAASWNSWRPTPVRPGELRRLMVNVYLG